MQPSKPVAPGSNPGPLPLLTLDDLATLPLLTSSGGVAVGPIGLSPTRFGDQASETGPTEPRPFAYERNAGLPRPGDWIGDTYRVESELGGGSMGVVFCALDKALERKVAIKLIRASARPEDFRKRFMLEARAMALISHPNVLTIYALGEHQANPFIVMELVHGQTLEGWLDAQSGKAELDAVLRILNQVCLGVSAIHAAGGVHRDLKPSNVLLDHQLRARVSDFGLAVRSLDGALAREVVGTPGYIAPEILFGRSGGATAQSDLYSLACIAYEMLTGSPPFSADDAAALAVLHITAAVPKPSSLRPGLPQAFDDVLLDALAKEPGARTRGVELFRRALSEAKNDSLEPVRILVAENDRDFLEILELLLRNEFPGADIECVCDGRSAMEAFDREPASVVVLDLQMPQLDGMDVTAMLRARASADMVPIIVVTASGGPKEWRILTELGADRFLVKPVNLDDLVSAIRGAARDRSRHPSEGPRATV